MKKPGLQLLLDLSIPSQNPVAPDQVFKVNSDEAIEQAKLNKIKQKEGSSAIYTRQPVVDFMLDLVGYTSEKPLFIYKILEPSFGNGDFLVRIIERLLVSIKAHDRKATSLSCLLEAIHAVELDSSTFEATKQKIFSHLLKYGIDSQLAQLLVNSWLVKGDFLLSTPISQFDFVVGNPPYIRQELIASSLIDCYRRLYKTFYGRADIYVAFMEKSLGLFRKMAN